MSAPGRMAPPLFALGLTLAGSLLILGLPHPLKLLMGGPLLATGLALLAYQFLREGGPHQRDLRRLEEEIIRLRTHAEREDQLRKGILNSLRVGVLVFGEDRRLLLANPAATRLLGSSSRLTAEAGLAETFRDPESLALMEAAFQGAPSEWTLRRDPRVLRVRALPFQAAFEARGVLITLDDVSRMEALETTRQKFISNASHELKTPVTALRVAAENLQDGQAVSSEGEASLRTIFRAVEKMTLLIEDISELSRIETGALVLEPQALQVAAFSQELMEDLRLRSQPKGIQLHLALGQGLEHLVIQADPLRLSQILDNLLSNAIKFSPKGSTVSLSVERSNAQILWKVRDQGPGIAPSEQARIFERFYRTNEARAVPGTGLGLAIVKHLARIMGGEITVESELGKGATFSFTMPGA